MRMAFLLFVLTFNMICFSQNGDLKPYNDLKNTLPEIHSDYMGKAYIDESGQVWLSASMTKEHRIFGYKKNINSEKLILLSVFTNEVKDNPFNCKYGAYYETSGMKDLNLTYNSLENKFVKINIVREGKIIDHVFMLKKWFEFEE